MQVLKSTECRTRLLKGWFQAYLGRQPTDVERRPGLRGHRAANTHHFVTSGHSFFAPAP